jgi:EmrB/QacA subfamily drug resistance transporter
MAAPPPAAAHSRLALTGLLLGLLLAGLDITVVGTSLGAIVGDIGGFELFTWLFAAYMLASTIVIPLAGKLTDRVGARPVYLAGMGVFLLGSALGGTASDIYQLIFYRAVQGLGGGMLFPVALAAIADLYAPSERPKIQAALGAVFGFSSVVGPSLGGFIVDNVHLFGIDSWRWVFYVNIPVGIAAIGIVAWAFPRTAPHRGTPLDAAGLGTLSLGLVAGLLITVLGGETYAWDSLPILGLAALSFLALAAFVWVERRAIDPVLPFRLFKDKVVAASAAGQFFMGMGMFAVITFMPTFMQGVVGISASNAGAVLTR